MSSPVPGTVVYHWFHGVFRHKGVVSDRSWNGKPMVFANSWTSNGVAEIPWEEFAGPRKVYVGRYPSALSPREVIDNARSMIGERYDAVWSNCEHFVCRCHGFEPRSRQLAAVVLAAGAAVLAVAVRA